MCPICRFTNSFISMKRSNPCQRCDFLVKAPTLTKLPIVCCLITTRLYTTTHTEENVSKRSPDRGNVALFYFTTSASNSLFHASIRNHVVCLYVSQTAFYLLCSTSSAVATCWEVVAHFPHAYSITVNIGLLLVLSSLCGFLHRCRLQHCAASTHQQTLMSIKINMQKHVRSERLSKCKH